MTLKTYLVLLFFYESAFFLFVSSYSCSDWKTVDGCSNYKSAFWAQTFTDNTPAISTFASFSQITVEGLYGFTTSIDCYCITANEGITIDRSLIREYLNGSYVDILQYSSSNTIPVHTGGTVFIDIPSSFNFTSPCIVNQNYGTSNISMNHAFILKYNNGGNGQICVDNGDTLANAGVIGGDTLGECTTYDFSFDADMHFTFDSYSLLIQTPSPNSQAQNLSCASYICTCSGNRACNIYCNTNDCNDAVLTCNSGYECSVFCNGDGSCNEAIIEANGASSLYVTCYNDGYACYQIIMNCQTTTDGCYLDCSDDYTYMCIGSSITCGGGGGECSIDCTGSGMFNCQNIVIDPTLSSSYSCVSTGADKDWCSLANVVTSVPTAIPSTPSNYPSVQPTISTGNPTSDPTSIPTFNPTSNPTYIPTYIPTLFPTSIPTFNPTSIPSTNPSKQPTITSTSVSSAQPTTFPSEFPTFDQTNNPSSDVFPSYFPTLIPTYLPTYFPINASFDSTVEPTNNPTFTPSPAPTKYPLEYEDGSSFSGNSKDGGLWTIIIIAVVFALIIVFVVISIIAYFHRKNKKLKEMLKIQSIIISAAVNNNVTSNINVVENITASGTAAANQQENASVYGHEILNTGRGNDVDAKEVNDIYSDEGKDDSNHEEYIFPENETVYI